MVSAGHPKPKRGNARNTGTGSSKREVEDQDWSPQEGGAAAGTAHSETRSQLNSSAADFTPGAFPCGGYDAAQYWDWQQSLQPAIPLLWREYADQDGQKYYYNCKTGLTQWERPPELDTPKSVAAATAASIGVADRIREGASSGSRRDGASFGERIEPRRGGSSGIADGGAASAGGAAGVGSSGGGSGSARGGGTNRASRRRGGRPDDAAPKKDGGEFGPPGCNLFVFHLPDDWTDDDLHEYFAPHGNVISAKVMKELGTGRSRGFGFVSYEDRVSAATAIKKMQGYKILGKRLKVEFKKGEQEGGKAEADDGGGERDEDDIHKVKKGQPDDERLIGYLRAISAKNVVQSLKESECDARARGETTGDEDGD